MADAVERHFVPFLVNCIHDAIGANSSFPEGMALDFATAGWSGVSGEFLYGSQHPADRRFWQLANLPFKVVMK